MFIASDLTCIRSGKTIFSHLGFCLQPESLLLLRGPNGSGKTSLLDMLSGALAPAAGEISWKGQPIKNNKDFARETMVIGHDTGVMPKKTVQQHLTATARRFDTEMLVPAALKFYELEDKKDVRAGELSNGWKRRMLLAQLIVAPCRLWLLDEPTDFLDEESVMLTVSLIETRVRNGGIVIAASHSLRSGIEAHVVDLLDFRPEGPANPGT